MKGFCTKSTKSLALGRDTIYKNYSEQIEFEDFVLPFKGKLDSKNRWVKLAKLIPWDEIEQIYAKNFAKTGMGAPAKAVRIALGALIIKEKLKISDEETVEQIQENPYLQYFIGYSGFSLKKPFDPSMMVHFRKRLDIKDIGEINQIILNAQDKPKKPKKFDDTDDSNKSTGDGEKKDNRGKLIMDATCAPADIKYPTDIAILNDARKKAEVIIDILYEPLKEQEAKPRTYRCKAHKEFMACIKKKVKSRKQIRKAIRKQLGYLGRDLNHIKKLVEKSNLQLLSQKEYKELLVITEVYRQQKWMYDNKANKITSRIVSISQPHVRPIVRGKSGAKVEFGAKIHLSLVDGYSYLDTVSWEPFNESEDLQRLVEKYYKRFGYYPKSLHADRIYRNRQNIQYCKGKGIRLLGPRLGRPKKLTDEADKKELQKQKRLVRKDERYRIQIEGKIGQGKRKYSLNKIMTKLAHTSETSIAVIFLVLNLEKLLIFFYSLLRGWLRERNIGLMRHKLA